MGRLTEEISNFYAIQGVLGVHTLVAVPLAYDYIRRKCAGQRNRQRCMF